MDNISHAVVSLVAGELLHRSLPVSATQEKQNLRQKLILFTAAAAGNFPDLDLVLYSLLKRPLGYLLHHRGHSHTLAGVVLEAALLFILVWSFWPSARRLLQTDRLARKGFAAAAATGFFLHLSMDWLNSYGIHPFYPLNTNWYYGDLVFIVEPLFWIGFGVPVAFLTRRVWLRYPLLLIVVGVPTFASLVKGYIPFPSLVSLLLIAVGLAVSQSKEFERGRKTLLTAFAIGALFLVSQSVASSRARAQIAAELSKQDPAAKLLDAALTAYPSNPICWTFVSIETSRDQYRLRSGVISLASSSVRPEMCPRLMGGTTGAAVALGENILQLSEEHASIAELQNLDSKNCHLHAWMRFARMPFVSSTEASDLRFAHGPRGNFTTIDLDEFKDDPCSTWIPPWEPPREDLLTK